MYRIGLPLFMVTGIFYLLPAGGPQISDLMMVAILGVATVHGLLRLRGPSLTLFVFVVYSFVVNAVWGFWLGGLSFYLASLYLTYNLMIFVLFVAFLERDPQRFGRLVMWAALIALAIETAYLLAGLGATSGPRRMGTFTNPNQLSYMGICFGGVVLIFAHRTRAGLWVQGLGLGLAWIVVLYGLSKAAIGAMVLMTGMVALRVEKLHYTLIAGLAVAALVMTVFQEQALEAYARMDAIGEDGDDNLAKRGYDRIWNEAEYLLFGAGEGMFARHDSAWRGELHSTFGTLLFCYGIVGFAIICTFFAQIMARRPFEFVAFVVPMFVYSLTHQGLRFTPFWILLAVVAARSPAPEQVPEDAPEDALEDVPWDGAKRAAEGASADARP